MTASSALQDNHTPCPWHEGSTIAGYTSFMVPGNDAPIAWVDFAMKADKTLALAAPDMLAALKAAESCFDAMADEGYLNNHRREVWRDMREAIEKAVI